MKAIHVSRGFAALLLAAPALAQQQGPSTLQPPYLLPSDKGLGITIISIASNGNGVTAPDETFFRLNTGVNDYRLVGIPDGMSAIRTSEDVADGTFTLIVNHELGETAGIVRDHGNRGAFVSRWKISADVQDMEVIGAQDHIQTVKLWNVNTNTYDTYNASNPMPKYSGNVLQPPPAVPPYDGIGRLCSGDMGAPTAYQFGNLGTDARIHLAGEEIGFPGRLFAHLVTGPEAGTTYELPQHGDYSWENAVVCPFPQEKTIVVGLDDSSPGQVFVWVGNKLAAGNDTQRAGLTDGKLYAVVIAGLTLDPNHGAIEDPNYILGTAATGPIESKPFSLFEFPDVTNMTGAALNAMCIQNGVVNWLRPEDGAWNPADPSRFYFVTTHTFTNGRSRIWELKFDDITKPELGGVATMLADGGNPASFAGGIVSPNGLSDVKMMDNVCMGRYGHFMVQEDVGNNARLGRVWVYDIDADSITETALADADRFLSGGAKYLGSQDEESSGIIDACDILGSGWFLLNMEAHYAIAGELVEGGQLLAMYVPQAACPGDLDCDGSVDQSDLGILLAAYGTCRGDAGWVPAAGNLAPDGCVGQGDLGVLLAHYGTSCK